jgi:hypothetical protein
MLEKVANCLASARARREVNRAIERAIRENKAPEGYIAVIAEQEGVPVELLRKIASKGRIRGLGKEIKALIEEKERQYSKEIYEYYKEEGWVFSFVEYDWNLANIAELPEYLLLYSDVGLQIGIQKENSIKEIEKKLIASEDKDSLFVMDKGKNKDYEVRRDSKLRPYVLWIER